MKSLHELWVELETWLTHFRHHAETVPPPPANPAPQSAPVEVATPKPATGSDNPMLDAYKQSNPQYADTSGGENAPAVDTSGETLEFSKVSGGVIIKLTGPKKVVGCPDKVRVQVFQVSGDPSARDGAHLTVNGVTKLGGIGIAMFEDVSGPEVSVSSDSPGYEFEIR